MKSTIQSPHRVILTMNKPTEETVIYDRNHAELARMIYTASLNTTPSGVARGKWMRDVRVGDLVVEISSWSPSNADDRMGELVMLHTDPATDDREGESAWVINTGAKVVTWRNAGFVRIPANEHERAIWNGNYGPFNHVILDCQECARARENGFIR